MENMRAATSPTVRKLSSDAEFDTLRPIWNELVEATESDNFFLTYEWNRTWWRAFGADHELYLLTVRDGEDIIGIAPLMRSCLSGMLRRMRVIRFIGDPDSDYGDFIGENPHQIAEQVWAYLNSHKRDWDRIELSQVPQGSPLAECLRQLLSASGVSWDSDIVDTCLGFTFEGSDADRLSFNVSRTHGQRQSMNRMRKIGEAVMERLDATADAEAELPLLCQLHINRWAGSPTPSKFLQPKYRRFYLDLVKALSPLKRLCFVRFQVGGIPISYSLNFEYKKTVYHYTLTYNVLYHRLSPGSLHLALQTEMLVRGGLDCDFSRGVHNYKELLTNRSSHNYRVIVYGRSLDHHLRRWYQSIRTTSIARLLLRNRMLMSIRARLQGRLAQVGLWRTLRHIGSALFRCVFDYRTFFVMAEDGRPVAPVTPQLPVHIRRLTKDDLDLIATLYGVPARSPRYEAYSEKLRGNVECYGAFHNRHLVSVQWCMYEPDIDPETGFTVTPKAGELVFSDAYTSPVYRGYRINPYMKLTLLKRYHERGLKGIGAVMTSNSTSMRNLLRTGFRPCRTIRTLRVFGRKVL